MTSKQTAIDVKSEDMVLAMGASHHQKKWIGIKNRDPHANPYCQATGGMTVNQFKWLLGHHHK